MPVVEQVFYFFQNQILGMQWLNEVIGTFLTFIGIDLTSMLGGALQFFIYDTIKICILLAVLIFMISYIQTYFPPERTKVILSRYKGIFANFMGAILGILTPFCSCSSIPLFMGFTSAGIPIGVTFSFLIASPLIDMAAFVLLMSIFGWKIALAYVVVGVLLAVIGGTIIEKLGMEDQVADFILNNKRNVQTTLAVLTKSERIEIAKAQVLETVKTVLPYIIMGVAIGALIHNVIPQSFIEAILGENNPFSVLLATITGIPMYASTFGVIPIAQSLYFKGVQIGTVLSFIMAVTALSLPSMILLKKAIKPKLMFTFVSIVTVGIIFIGYLFNALAFIF